MVPRARRSASSAALAGALATALAGHIARPPGSPQARAGLERLSSGKGVSALRNSRQGGLMETLANNLSGWTTDELLAEVFERSAGDRPALQLLHLTTIRALLAEGDDKYPAKSVT